MKRDIRMERFYPYPRHLVWRAITDKSLMERWMQMENNFEAIVGHQFELKDISGNWDGVLSCKVILVDPPEQLAYSFKGGSMRHETTVTITLSEEQNGTRLKLDHTGFTGFVDIIFSGIFGYGWRRMFKLLASLLTTENTQEEQSP